MAKTKRQTAVDSGVQNIINARTGGGQAQAKAAKPNPLGVVLEQSEIDQLDRIAKELGIDSRHQVLQYAVRQFLARWDKGERPPVKKRTVNVLDVD